jgi:hypothetical protein
MARKNTRLSSHLWHCSWIFEFMNTTFASHKHRSLENLWKLNVNPLSVVAVIGPSWLLKRSWYSQYAWIMVTHLQFLSRLYCDGEEASQHRQVSHSVDSVITRVLKHILLCNRRHHFQSSVSCDTLDSLEAYMIFCHRGSWSGLLSFFWLWIICMQIMFFTGILRQAYTHRFSVFLKPL